MKHVQAIVMALLCCPILLSGQTHKTKETPASSQSSHDKSDRKPSPEDAHRDVMVELLNSKVERLERQMQQMQQSLSERDIQLQQSQATAAAAQAAANAANERATRAEETIGTSYQQLSNLQGAVADLKQSSVTTQKSIADGVKANIESQSSLHFMGVTLKPGGFLAGETVWRRRGIGGDINTQFTGIPFAGQTAGTLSEFNVSARQSRLSLLAEGHIPGGVMRGYYETDFLSSGTTSNDNQSNSYTMRTRQLWGQAQFGPSWTFTAGQTWSLATEYKSGSGLSPRNEAIPMTIDAQYNAGFTWARQAGFRVVRTMGKQFAVGFAAEEPQTLNIGGHNLAPLVYQQAGNSGGLYNATANYSFNRAPDLILKVSADPHFGHYELFAIGRFFRDRIYPDVCWTSTGVSVITGASCSKVTTFPTLISTAGAANSKTEGGGVGANARVTLLHQLDVGAHVLIGDGIGRYSTSTLPDVTGQPDGSLEPLKGGSGLGSLEWHRWPRLDLYGYYGGEYVAREFYVNPAGTLTGYGAPTNVTRGCQTEAPPAASPNGGGNVPGSPSSCTADNRNIQEGTIGYWYRLYKGDRGTLQQGFQFSYVARHTWLGAGGSPKAIDDMWFASFRYYLPQ